MYKYNFDEFDERPIPVVPSDWLLVTLLRSSNDIYNYHLHNALLENRPEEELTDEDKKLAWEEFNNMEETASMTPFFLCRTVLYLCASPSRKRSSFHVRSARSTPAPFKFVVPV
jgi:hypothetical protein